MPDEFSQKLFEYIGKQVLQLREKKNFTQEYLAQQLDVSRVTITNIEKGNNGVAIDTFVKLCACLDCSPNDLLPNAKLEERDVIVRKNVIVF